MRALKTIIILYFIPKVKENVSKMSDSTEKIKEQVKESTSTFTG